MSGVLHHRLELAQAKEGDAEGAHQSSSSDIIAKEDDSFSFVHPPKCGTSMIALLRNYLPSCKVKNWTCFGVLGGGFYSFQTMEGEDTYPYSPELLNISSHEMTAESTCNGTLAACLDNDGGLEGYHSHSRANAVNPVILLRNSSSRLASLYKWLGRESYVAAFKNVTVAQESLQGCLETQPTPNSTCGSQRQSLNIAESEARAQWPGTWHGPPQKIGKDFLPSCQVPYVNGDPNNKDVTKAQDALLNRYAFWGLLDHLETSVCLFNCEFNVDLGLPLNTRPAQSLPKVDGIPEQPDTEFDWGKFCSHDDELILMMKPHFLARARTCGCPVT